VSCAFLQAFLADKPLLEEHWTTKQVVEAFIKPQTVAAECSVWEALSASGAAEREALVGRSTVMVSHSWSNSFQSLVATLLSQATRHGEAADTYYFIDIFCMNQHALAGAGTSATTVGKGLLLELKQAVSFPGRMVMIAEPWHAPEPLTRCWCLYELYLASATDAKVEMAFSGPSELEVSKELMGNLDLAGDILQRLDVREARATVERDRRMILDTIQAEIGFDAFIAQIKAKLADSLYLATLGPLFLSAKTQAAAPCPGSSSVPPLCLQPRGQSMHEHGNKDDKWTV